MSINKVTKNNLAKLLATENIDVEHRNVSTAAFDVKNRRLILPIWENVSNDVYDLLVGHEVGHALFTPQIEIEDLCKSIDENNAGTVKSFLNVVEDARIEKKIKRKFNGLRKNFNNGYAELLEKNFFGLEGRELDSYSFIDRINIQFKLGSHIDVIPFSPEEKEVIKRIDNLETFEEVVDVVKEIYATTGDSETEKNIDDSEFFDDDDQGFGDQEVEETTSGPNKNDEGGEETEDTTDSDEESDLDEEPSAGNGPNNEPPQDSETQRNLDRELEDLVDDKSDGPNYIGIPNINSEDFVIDQSEVYDKEIREWIYTGTTPDDLNELKEEYQKFKKDSIKTVNYLVKEFELKKNAEQHMRAQVNKSGVLDVNKLHSYRFCEDVFKRVTTLPGGKNHGLVLFLDWSGSMSGSFESTVKQLLNLAYFCKKVNIPFDVYSFHSVHPMYQDSTAKAKTPTYTHNDYVLDNFHLKNILSSRQKGKSFEEAAFILFCIADHFKNGYSTRKYISSFMFPSDWSLGGTPLNEAIITGFDIVKKFRSKYGVSKVNVVLLTDGDGHPPNGIYNDEPEYGKSYGVKTIRIRDERYYRHWPSVGEEDILHRNYIVDKETKKEYGVNSRTDVTRGLLMAMRERFDVNVIGYYIADSRGSDFRSAVTYQLDAGDNEEYTKYKKEFGKNGFVVGEQVGYTAFFIIKGGKTLDTTTEKLDVDKGVTKRVLTTAFKKHNKSKLTNRVVLTKFVELIS